MPMNALWLERLNRATNYGELQEVFSEIVADAQAGGDNAELAQSIDEAIRRLEEERARDEIGLQEVQSQYDSFRAANQGMVGWLKRHLPFTETRRKEHEHRENVAEQTAEILGDNLVIARAQMVKERFQSGAERKLGHRPADWRVRLDAAMADRQPVQLGKALQDVAGEIDRSRAFLNAIKHDIDAFGRAEFKTAEDRQRRDADASAARRELADLTREVDENAALKQAGLKQLAARTVSELEQSDAAFHADGQQIHQLRTVLAHATDARSLLGKLVESTAALGKLSKELHGLPAEIKQVRDELMRLENQHLEAQAAGAKKAGQVEEQRGGFDAAQREVEQTRQLLASAQQFYEAYQAEFRAKQATPMMAEAEDPPSGTQTAKSVPADSPMLRKLNEAKASADAAQMRLREATSPFETARREADAAQTVVQNLATQVKTERDKLQTLERRLPQLRRDLTAAMDRTQEAFAAGTTGLGLYLASDRGPAISPFRPQELAAGTFGWLGPRGLEHSLADALVQAERDYQRFLQGSQVLDALSKWLDAQRHSIEKERTAAQQRRESAWKRRCSDLLGESLADEACKGGLASLS
jgi:hypothetical protein